MATAIRTVAWRIVLFYIGSVFIMVAILPPSQADPPEGPFAGGAEPSPASRPRAASWLRSPCSPCSVRSTPTSMPRHA
ncbi:hypothetical protein QJS66_11170 [Kocuria rhizophila]|nr:hypothetical protein QJS66_11170 [Kocuria rhizophila]